MLEKSISQLRSITQFHRRAYHQLPGAARGCLQFYNLLENSTVYNTHIFYNRRRPWIQIELDTQ